MLELPSENNAKTRAVLRWSALASVAACGGAGAAHASVVYTSANLPVDNGTSTQEVDFDNDGINDVTVNYGPPTSGFTTETNLKISLSSTAAFVSDGQTNGEGANNVVAFNAGDLIGSSLAAGDSYQATTTFGGGNLFTPAQTDSNGTAQSASGDFPESAGEKFVGISFTAGGNTSGTPNYAYIAFETTDDSSTDSLAGTVLGYAYETQPGVAIAAGAVPEPTGLALLAMGAAGLARYRGRRASS